MSVFVSYSHVDTDFVKALTELLEKHNVPYFLDSKDINWGSSISDEIRQAFDNAEYLIVVISPASLKSSWVPYEIGLARGKNAKILPILTHPSLDVPTFLGDIKHITSLDAVSTFFSFDFRRQIRLSVLLKAGYMMPLIKIVGEEQAEKLGIARGTVGFNHLPLDDETLPVDKLPSLHAVVTNNESREVDVVSASIEFKDVVRLNPDEGSDIDALSVQQKLTLRPSGVAKLRLPVEFTAVIEAFCSGNVSGVYIKDNQQFRCYASDEELSRAAAYFCKFFRHFNVDQLREEYTDYLY